MQQLIVFSGKLVSSFTKITKELCIHTAVITVPCSHYSCCTAVVNTGLKKHCTNMLLTPKNDRFQVLKNAHCRSFTLAMSVAVTLKISFTVKLAFFTGYLVRTSL